MEDNNSKFGSLLRVREGVNVDRQGTFLQLGRSLIGISTSQCIDFASVLINKVKEEKTSILKNIIIKDTNVTQLQDLHNNSHLE